MGLPSQSYGFRSWRRCRQSHAIFSWEIDEKVQIEKVDFLPINNWILVSNFWLVKGKEKNVQKF